MIGLRGLLDILLGRKSEAPVEPKPVTTKPAEIQFKELVPPHLSKMLSYVNKNERDDINWIKALFAYTSFPPAKVNDQTSWCAAMICMVMSACDLKSTRSAAARDQLKLGDPCGDDEPGAVAIWEHADGPMKGHCHVNMIIRKNPNGTWRCIGGNQGMIGTGGGVTISNFGPPHYKLLGTRRPVKAR